MKVIGATQDISDQKRTEAALFKSNERYDLMLKATNELLWEWDMQTNVMYRSDHGIKKVYGMDDDSAVKTQEQWLQRIHPDDHDIVKRTISNIYQGEHMEPFEMEYRFFQRRQYLCPYSWKGNTAERRKWHPGENDWYRAGYFATKKTGERTPEK